METLEIDFMTPKIFFIDKDIYIYIFFLRLQQLVHTCPLNTLR